MPVSAASYATGAQAPAEEIVIPTPGGTRSVDVDGDRVLLGAYGEAAFVYSSVDGAWVEEARLEAEDSALGDNFGRSVALDGDTAIVGAPGVGASEGAAYVFTYIDGVWTQQAELAPEAGPTTAEQFGRSVGIAGDTAIVGAPGAAEGTGMAYVFARADGVWTQQADLFGSGVAAGDRFGYSVAVDAGTAVAGAPQSGFDVGSAYVFTTDGTGWTEQAKLVPIDLRSQDLFGRSIAINGDTIVVGAPNQQVPRRGAAYLFARDDLGHWGLQARFEEPDYPGFGNGHYGRSVDVDEDLAVVGADGSNRRLGEVFIYTRDGRRWGAAPTLLNDAPRFGHDVAVDDDTIIVGTFAGNAYLYPNYVPNEGQPER